MLVLRNFKKKNVFSSQLHKEISTKPWKFSRNYTVSNDDIEKQYKILKHSLSIFNINESKDLMAYEKSHAYHQQLFYEISKFL